MAGWIVLGLIVIVLIWGITTYNRLVKQRNQVLEGWSGIDVQLKRRHNLIPNLVETVKGYMKHEEGVLTKVTELRNPS
jgi:LemA protein